MALKSPDDFETIKELKEYTRVLIDGMRVCSSLKTRHPYAYIYFRELFQRHPDKEKKKTDRIVDIRIDRYPKGDYQFTVIWDDMNSDTISWTACVRQKPRTYLQKLNQALRNAVGDQMTDFRIKHHRETCSFCGTSEALSVDHIVHFAKLVYDFIKIHGAAPTELGKNHIQQDCFKEEDSVYEKAWSDYHRNHAELRILCMPCNMNRERWISPEDATLKSSPQSLSENLPLPSH